MRLADIYGIGRCLRHCVYGIGGRLCPLCGTGTPVVISNLYTNITKKTLCGTIPKKIFCEYFQKGCELQKKIVTLYRKIKTGAKTGSLPMPAALHPVL